MNFASKISQCFMDKKQQQKNEILTLAKKTMRDCDLLIEQSDNWLSEEEGIKNVEKRLNKSSCPNIICKIHKFLKC